MPVLRPKRPFWRGSWTVVDGPFPHSLRQLGRSLANGQASTEARAIRLVPATPPLALTAAVEKFLLNRRARGCTERTLEIYERNLNQFSKATDDNLAACTPPAVQQYLIDLRARMKLVSCHQHYRCLRTFFAWAVEAGVLTDSPLRGLIMITPKTLPRVPDDDEVRGLLAACATTFEGTRNKALVALLADSGLRIGEALRLRVENVSISERTLSIRTGKGQKDRVAYFAASAAAYLRTWLGKHPDPSPESFLFCIRQGQPITRHHATHILHRLSVKAGLSWKIGPHALRHYAGTSILRRTGDLELVRQILGHETLAMTLKYARLTKPEVSAKFKRASPLDNLLAGR